MTPTIIAAYEQAGSPHAGGFAPTNVGLRLANLVRQLREALPSLVKLIAVPSLPAHYLARADRLRTLRDAFRTQCPADDLCRSRSRRVRRHT